MHLLKNEFQLCQPARRGFQVSLHEGQVGGEGGGNDGPTGLSHAEGQRQRKAVLGTGRGHAAWLLSLQVTGPHVARPMPLPRLPWAWQPCWDRCTRTARVRDPGQSQQPQEGAAP